MKEGAVDKGAASVNGQKKCFSMPPPPIQLNGNQQTKGGGAGQDLFTTTTDSTNRSIMTTNNNNNQFSGFNHSNSRAVQLRPDMANKNNRVFEVKPNSRLQMYQNSVSHHSVLQHPAQDTCYVKIVEDSRADSLELVLGGSQRVVVQRQIPQMALARPVERSMKKAVFRGAKKLDAKIRKECENGAINSKGAGKVHSQTSSSSTSSSSVSSFEEKEVLDCEMVIPTPARLNNQMISAVELQGLLSLSNFFYRFGQ
uniref:Uncharacterized protein n=1 Tax=Ditylenchus dipsaci TaxID=166011 RepID=A0A915EGQ4_9BILA